MTYISNPDRTNKWCGLIISSSIFFIWLYVPIVLLSTPMPTNYHFLCIQKERKAKIAHTWTINMALYLAGGWMKAAWSMQRGLCICFCLSFVYYFQWMRGRVSTGGVSQRALTLRLIVPADNEAPVPRYKRGRTGEGRSTAANQTWPFLQHYCLFLSLAMLSRESPFFQQRPRQWRWTISTKTLIKHC